MNSKHTQEELDRLKEEYLIFLRDKNGCNIKDLENIYGTKTFKYMIFRFTEEVQRIWKANEVNE